MRYNVVLNPRSIASTQFQEFHLKAVLGYWLAQLLRKSQKLAAFRERLPHPTTTRAYLGIQDIPVKKITGSLGREGDFDNHFRPLKKHLRDRWVSIYLLFKTERVPPIRVYKVKDDYYVEDGHHRVSVARYIDMAFIQAEVWEYPAPARRVERDLSRCSAPHSAIAARDLHGASASRGC
jgi:hypothetical protein